MDKLIFPSGGMFLDAEDLEFQDAAYRGAMVAGIKAVADLTANGVMILSGCNYVQSVNGQSSTSDVVALSEGYIYIGGEICYFAGGAVSRNIQQVGETPTRYFFEFITDFDPNGNEILANGTTGNTYQKRRVILTKYVNQFNETLYFEETPRYLDVLKQYITNQYNITTSIVFIYNGVTAPVDNRAKMNRVGKVVKLEGQLVLGSILTNVWNQICRLSSGFRPIQTIYRPLIIVGKGVIQVRIEVDGYVYFNDPLVVALSGDAMEFGGMSFETE